MCFSTLGLKVPGMRIRNPGCVGKTFPNYYAKLAAPPPGGLSATLLNAATGRPLVGDELHAEALS
jgi:3-phosphoshikimate 1-carboxyvinyltransferase